MAGAGIDPKWLAINNIMASFWAIFSKFISDSSTTRANSSRTITDTFTDSGCMASSVIRWAGVPDTRLVLELEPEAHLRALAKIRLMEESFLSPLASPRRP